MLAVSRADRHSVGAAVVALLCLVGVGFFQIPQLNQLKSSQQAASQATLERDVESEKLRLNLLQKLPSFGFNNAIANWVYLNFLVYFGDDEARAKTGYSLSPEYFEVILPRDPHFLQAYLALSTSTSLYAALPERSITLIEQGLKSVTPTVPDKSYYIWRYKGTDELLFLGDEQAARQSFEKAAEWAEIDADEESKQVAALSRQTADFLARNPDSKSAQVAAWTMVLTNQVDEKTRAIAIRRIQELGGQVLQTPQGFAVRPPREQGSRGAGGVGEP